MSTDVVGPPSLVEQLYSELEQKVRVLRPKDDFTQLEKAYRVASEAHKDQKRVSGEPYMVHPLLVTRILADMHMDMVCLETGLLHDVVEDTAPRLEEIRKEFRRRSGALRRRRHQAEQAQSLHRARSGRRRASARCCWPWSTISASSW